MPFNDNKCTPDDGSFLCTHCSIKPRINILQSVTNDISLTLDRVLMIALDFRPPVLSVPMLCSLGLYIHSRLLGLQHYDLSALKAESIWSKMN